MADQNNSNNNNQGQGQGDSPQFKNIEANTMNSDMQSIKDQGGNEPKSYEPPTNVGESTPSSQAPEPVQKPNPNESIGKIDPPATPGSLDSPAPASGSNNQDFQPPQPMDGSSGNQEFKAENISGDQYPPKKSGGKKLFITLLILIIVIGAGVAAYILFFSGNNAEVPVVDETNEEEMMGEETNEQSNEELNEDENFELPQGVPGDEINEEESTEEVTEEETEETEEVVLEPHSSLFSTSADAESDVTIDSVSVENVKGALNFESTEVPLFREVVMRDAEGQLVEFSSFANAFAPSVFTSEVASSFNQDATYFTYTDSNGTWFGFAAEVNSEADLESVKTAVAAMESNTEEVENFFIADPGTSTEWADGAAGEITTRYLPFSNGNSSFNYGWSGNTLVVGTSYQSLLELDSRL